MCHHFNVKVLKIDIAFRQIILANMLNAVMNIIYIAENALWTHSNRNLIRSGLDLIISECSEHPEHPLKTSKTGHLRVLWRKSSGAKIAIHANSTLPSCVWNRSCDCSV